MTDKPIDLARTRAALAKLDALAEQSGLKPPGVVTDADIDALEHELEEAMADNDARIGLRLPPGLRERVERYRQQKAELVPGMRVTISDAARMLIIKGLEAEEGGTDGQH